MTKLDTILKKLIGILGWLKLMNVTLLSGATWSSGSKVIDGISKYIVLYVITNAGNGYAIVNGNTIELISGIKTGGACWSTYLILELNGDTATINTNESIDHVPTSTHGAILRSAEINKIIGVLPAWGGTKCSDSKAPKGVVSCLINLIPFFSICLDVSTLYKNRLQMVGITSCIATNVLRHIGILSLRLIAPLHRLFCTLLLRWQIIHMKYRRHRGTTQQSLINLECQMSMAITQKRKINFNLLPCLHQLTKQVGTLLSQATFKSHSLLIGGGIND